MGISYPQPGYLQLSDMALFSTPESTECRKFIATLFQISEVCAIEISSTKAAAEVRFDKNCSAQQFAKKVGEQLLVKQADSLAHMVPALKIDWKGQVQVYRYNLRVSTWKIASDIPGRIRLRNTRLFRKKRLCQDIERELMSIFGIERFKVNSLTCSVLIYFEEKTIDKAQILDLLEKALYQEEDHLEVEKSNYELLICTGTVGLSVVAQFLFPPLMLPAAGLFIYCAIPTFSGAIDTIFKERRLGVDVLDAMVVVMCLISGELFAGAVLTWCLSFGRALLAKAQEDSRRRLINVFGKQVRTACLYQNGEEIIVPLEKIKPNDIVAVHTGEVIPVDGVLSEGAAIVDQHILTGESVPAEKTMGSRVYASTLVIGGKMLVTVEKAGKDTTSAQISTILNETAAFRLTSQSKGEELADKAVIPTLSLASLGYATVGLHGATAIINCDFGTGIRMAAPLALLSSLSVCANRGILVKDGRALEEMTDIDTVLFDKTGTLTQERPIVERIHVFSKLNEEQILSFAAAAEHRLNHPIAVAIVEKFRSLGKPFPKTDESSYKIGYGISVQVGKKNVLVGSQRFMKLEESSMPKHIESIEQEAHAEGNSIVFVSVNKTVVGAIELAPTLRSGVPELIAGLRARGVRQIVIISGDHEKPTQKLAQALGVDRYFAEVLPADKARYVELLQQEGRKVCFVGDGINDSIALKRANVSVSLRGATTVATDTAQLVFMDDKLWKLCEFIDISKQLEHNINTSWVIILIPNLFCIAGAFFLGFGVMASVLANNVAAIGALANGLRPLRMFSDPNTDLTSKEKSDGWNNLWGLKDFFSRKTSQITTALGPDNLMEMIIRAQATRKTAALFILAGSFGTIIPGIPSWPLIKFGISLLSRQFPGLVLFDQWLSYAFPNAHGEAIGFAFKLFTDMQRRFPSDPGVISNA